MQPRHLQHMSIEAFYGLYQLWCAGNQYQDDNVAKIRRFTQVFEEKWKHLLRFREVSQHARYHHHYLDTCFFVSKGFPHAKM